MVHGQLPAGIRHPALATAPPDGIVTAPRATLSQLIESAEGGEAVSDELLEQIRSMAPWHMNVPLTEGIRTGQGNPGTPAENIPISLINPMELRPLLERLYPAGLTGKRFLDCACNAGGYSLLASDLGADYCFGFDVREHWIRQARFLQRHQGKNDDQVRFDVCDLLDLDERLSDERFDICLFKGIFELAPVLRTGWVW